MEILSKKTWRRKRTRLTSTSFIPLILIIFLSTLSYGNCRRLSFKESLTAFTESPDNVLDSDLMEHPKTVSHTRHNPPEKIPRLKMRKHPFLAEALPPSVKNVDKIIMIELEPQNLKPSQPKQSVKCRFPFSCPSSSQKLKTVPAQNPARLPSINPIIEASGFGQALIQKDLDDSKEIAKTKYELEPHHHNHEVKPNFSSFSQKLVENGFHSSASADTHPRKGPFSLWELTKNIFFQFQHPNVKSKNESEPVPAATFQSIPIVTLPEMPLSFNNKNKDVEDGKNSKDSMNSPNQEAPLRNSSMFFKNTRNLLQTMKIELDRFVTKNGTELQTATDLQKFSVAILNPTKSRAASYLGPQKSVFLNMKSKGDAELEQSERAKKNVLSTFGWGWTPASGLSNLALSTAKALWSVNKEHFLPTFLHTKTGGKLSLIRDSIFKPVTILSQFKSGVAQIQHEKSHNLARHHNHGWGWSSQPVHAESAHSRLFTLARYIYKLSRHTVVTKWRLKRALLDLQLRAVRKLLRIVSNKSFGQKLATVRILLNAGLQAKQGFFHALRAAVQTTTTEKPMPMKPYGHYPGSDNSQIVDLTYSAPAPAPPMNQYGPPMPPMPTPSNSYQSAPPAPSNLYQSPPPSNSYQSPAAPLSDNYQGPPPSIQQPPSDYGKFLQSYSAPPPPSPQIQMSSKQSRFPSTLFAPPPPPNPLGISEPLIEAPSYASLLHTMGINPSNYKALQTPPTSTSASNIITFTTNRAPSPPSTKSTFFNQPSSSSTASTPKSSFRLKLLEQMSVDTLGMS